MPSTTTIPVHVRRGLVRASLAASALVLALPVLPSQAVHAGAAQCSPTLVELRPVVGTNHRLYEGRTPTRRIRFVSERAGELVDNFPEPPVRIIHRTTGAACLIRDGGVWARTAVFVGDGGRRFLLLEGSGSGAAIIVYDADTCARRAELDVSEARWRFTEVGVELGRQCTGTTIDECNDRQVIPLSADCVPLGK